MAQALFITRQDLISNSILSGNVDTDKFIQFVKIAQDIHIQNYLGTDLFNKIKTDIEASSLTGDYLSLLQDYIVPCLIHFALVDYLPFSAYTVANGGMYKHTSENSESVTKDEVEYLVEKHRGFANFYTRRMIDYIAFNLDKFPEYNSNSKDRKSTRLNSSHSQQSRMPSSA